MKTAIIIAIVALGSVLFHLMSPWWWTPIASNWSYIDNTIILTFWITGTVFVAVVLFVAYCLFRFRHEEGRRAAYEPENKKLEFWLTVATAVGVAAMLAPGPFRLGAVRHGPGGATELEIVGQQWQWSFRLPGQDGRLGTAYIRHVPADNPLGINPNDPNGKDDRRDRRRRTPSAARSAREGPAPLHRCAARFLCAGVPRQDGLHSRHGDLFLAHADPDRNLRRALRRILRRRASHHAGQGHGRQPRPTIRPGWGSRRRSPKSGGTKQRRG